jgi:hypothetical protein
VSRCPVREGAQIREAIIKDPDTDPRTPRLRASDGAVERNGWIDRIEAYLYQSLSALTS